MKRKLLTFSASQIKQFDRCPAFWAFNRVMGLPDVQTDKARRGVEIHREMELYAKLGQWPESKAGKKLAALYVCPPPGVAEVEVPVRYALPGGTEWVGYIDAVAEAGVGSDYRVLSGDEGATVVLIDWKTTSDLKYALTPDQLRADTAANIYAHEAFAGGAGSVVLRWVYVKANGEGKPRVVEVAIDRADNAAFMAELDTLGWFLQQLYDMDIDPHLLTKEPDNCFKYGAMCPYREPCAPPSSGANDYTVEEITVTNDEFLTKIAPPLPKRPAPPLPPKAALQKALDDGAKSPLVGDGVGVLDRVLTRLSETPREPEPPATVTVKITQVDREKGLIVSEAVEANTSPLPLKPLVFLNHKDAEMFVSGVYYTCPPGDTKAVAKPSTLMESVREALEGLVSSGVVSSEDAKALYYETKQDAEHPYPTQSAIEMRDGRRFDTGKQMFLDAPCSESAKALLEAAVAPEKAGWRDIKPTVEAGVINAPEGANVPLAATPEEAAAHQGRDKPPAPVDELDDMDKQALFVLAVKEGCFQPTDKVKLREQGLRRVIREARTKRAVLGESGPVPKAADVPVVAERPRLTEQEGKMVEAVCNSLFENREIPEPTVCEPPVVDKAGGEALLRAQQTEQVLGPEPSVDEQIAALEAVRAPGYGCLDPQSEIVGLLHRIATALETLAAAK